MKFLKKLTKMTKEKYLKKHIEPYIKEIVKKIDDKEVTDIVIYGISVQTIMMFKKNNVWEYADNKYFSNVRTNC